MYYMKWMEGDLDGRMSGLAKANIGVLLTEVDEQGRVLRELGLDGNNAVMHRAETGKEGFFNGQTIEPGCLRNEMTPDEFENLWSIEATV